MPDSLGERLRAVDDKQTRHRWIEAPLDQVVDQCLHHSTVLSCPLHQSKRLLEALAIDPERSHQHEMLTDVDAVDLHHHDVEAGQIRPHPFLHARSRQCHEVPRSCRLRYSGPRWRGNIALGKPHRSAEFPRRYVDQHQVHRPLAEPVLRDRTLPARQRQFMALKVAHAGPLNRHLASVEADLALGSAPAMTAPAIAAGMASHASLLGVLFHHGSERLDPGRQTKSIKADRNRVPSFVHSPHSCRRQSGQCCDSFLHGVAFLSWNQHPEPTGSRRATPLLLFQHSPGQFLQVETEIDSALNQLQEFLDFDRSNIFEFTADGWATILASAARAGVERHPLGPAPAFLSLYIGQVRAGKVMRVQSIEDLPPEAIEQIAYHRRVGIRSSLGLPLRVGGRIVGVITFASFHSTRKWPDDLIARLKVVGEVMAQALARKRAETALQASEERWRSMFESSNLGIAVIDENWHYAATNTAFQAMLGYTDDELQQLTPLDVTAEEDLDANRMRLTELQKGERRHYETLKQFR